MESLILPLLIVGVVVWFFYMKSNKAASSSSGVTSYQQGNRFKHPLNGYIEEISSVAWLWVLLFGPLYWAVKGVWSHAIIQLVLYFFVIGFFVHFIYPFFAHSILRGHYLKNGWEPV